MSAVCQTCGSSVRLRWDRDSGGWQCVNSRAPSVLPERRRRRKREPLFNVNWTDPDTGRRWRATRTELTDAWRLWAIHADVRSGDALALVVALEPRETV